MFTDRKLEYHIRVIKLYRTVRNKADSLITPYELRLRSELIRRDGSYSGKRVSASLTPQKSGYVDPKWALGRYAKEELLESGAASIAAEKLREYEKGKTKGIDKVPPQVQLDVRVAAEHAISDIGAHETRSTPRLEVKVSDKLYKSIEMMLKRIRIFKDFPVDPK